jgi:hypothetical protein
MHEIIIRWHVALSVPRAGGIDHVAERGNERLGDTKPIPAVLVRTLRACGIT